MVAGGMKDPNEVSSGVLGSKIQKSIANIINPVINPVIHNAHTPNPVAVDIQEALLRLEEPGVDKSGATNQTLSLLPTEYPAIDKNTILDLADFLILMASPGDQREGLGDLGGREGNKSTTIMESNTMHVAATGAARRISASPSSQHAIGGWDVATDADLETFQDSATGTDKMMEIVGPLGLVMAPGDFEFGGMGRMSDGVEELGALKATTIVMHEVTNRPDPPTALEESASPVPVHAVDQLRVVEPNTNFEASQITHGRSIPQENSISETPHHTTPMLGDVGDIAGWDSHVEVATAQKSAMPGSRDVPPIATTNPRITHGHIIAQEDSILGRETPRCTTPMPGDLGDMAGCDSKIPGKNLDIPLQKPAVSGSRDVPPIATTNPQITHGHTIPQEGSILGRETPRCTTLTLGDVHVGDIVEWDSSIEVTTTQKSTTPGNRDIQPLISAINPSATSNGLTGPQTTNDHTITREDSIPGYTTPGDVGDMAGWDSVEVPTIQKPTTPENRDIQPPTAVTNPFVASEGTTGLQITIAEGDTIIEQKTPLPTTFMSEDVGDMAGRDSSGEVAAIQESTIQGSRDIQPPIDPFAAINRLTGLQITDDHHTLAQGDEIAGRATPHYTTLTSGDVRNMTEWDSNAEVAMAQKPIVPGNRNIQLPTTTINPSVTSNGLTGPHIADDHIITQEDEITGRQTPHRALLGPGVGDITRYDITMSENDIKPPVDTANSSATNRELASLYPGHGIDEWETTEPVTKLETTQNPSTEPATIRHPVLTAISQGSQDRGDMVSESQESAAHNLDAILAKDGIHHNNLTGGITATGKALSSQYDTDGREATGQPTNPKTTRPTEGVPSTSVPRTQSPDVIATAEALGDMRYVAVQQPAAQKAITIETTSYPASKPASTTCVRSAEILGDRDFGPGTRTESPKAADILGNMVQVLPDERWPKPQVSNSSIVNNPVYESTDPENDIPKPKTQLSVKTAANHGTSSTITPNHTSTTATTLLFTEQGIGAQNVKEEAMKPGITGTAGSDFSPTTHMDPPIHVITGVTGYPENTVEVHGNRKSTIQNSTAVARHADYDPPRVAATLDKSAHLPLGHDDDQRQPTYQIAAIQTVPIADGSSSTIGMFAYVSLFTL